MRVSLSLMGGRSGDSVDGSSQGVRHWRVEEWRSERLDTNFHYFLMASTNKSSPSESESARPGRPHRAPVDLVDQLYLRIYSHVVRAGDPDFCAVVHTMASCVRGSKVDTQVK